MGEVIALSFGRKTTDGGKSRILARRTVRNLAEPIHDWRDEDLTMDHADNGMPSDSAYSSDNLA